MSLVEIFILAVFVPVGLWFLYNMFMVAEQGKRMRDEDEAEAPYKLEPNEDISKYDFSPHIVAISEEFNKDQPATRAKRKYTKRNKAYWKSAKLKAKLKKARSAKKKVKRVIL